MKLPETIYIWKKQQGVNHLVFVTQSGRNALCFIKSQFNEFVVVNVKAHMNVDIPIGHLFLVTSYLKWKSYEKKQTENIILEANRPHHLRFTGFNYKFDECELEEELTTIKKR